MSAAGAMADLDLGGLSLAEDGEEGLRFDVAEEDATNDLRLCLVGRFLIDRPICVVIIKSRMAGIWRPMKGATIKETSPGIFLFQFFHVLDMENVFRGGPWSFDNYLLILGRL